MKYQITAPDGRKFDITAPEGATEDQVMSYAKQNWDRRQKQKAEGEADMQRLADPTSGMSGMEKFTAGMGKAFTDLGRGAGQLVGYGPNQQEMQDIKRQDAPLMGTLPGVSGNIAGNIAALAPAALIPGAGTIPGAAALGGLTGALQPTETTGERLTNMAVGGVLGGGTQALGTVGARKLGEMAATRETRKAAQVAQDSIRSETLKKGVEAGYVVPPSAVNASFVNKRLESIAGKAAVGQEAAIRNQSVTDALARRAAGVPETEPLTMKTLEAARNRLAEPYREVSQLSQFADDTLTQLKEARQNANKFYKAYERIPLPSLESKAQRFKQTATMLEERLEKSALDAGKAGLVKELRNARVALAKNYDVERALNLGSGEIDASVLGRAYDRGAPFTGELETIAKMQQAFRPYMREGGNIPTPGVSKSEALASALLGTMGGAAAGPAGIAAGALPLVSGPARSMVLSPMYQKANVLAQPQGAGMLTREMAMLKDPEVQRQLALALRMGVPGMMASQPVE